MVLNHSGHSEHGEKASALTHKLFAVPAVFAVVKSFLNP